MTSPLIVDVYAGDVDGRPNWSVLATLGPPWHGAIIKATEGAWYAPRWFDSQWRTLREIAGDRYGVDWFRGAYHFLKFNTPGIKQADWYCTAIERAGGWDKGDLWPIVDVEMGGEKNSNQLATAEMVIDCVSSFAERCKAILGRQVMLYGNGAMRDLRINNRMGCDWIWCPRYTPTLPQKIYERAGWTRDQLVLWQYCGDGEGYLAGYPTEVPGFGKVDISVLIPPVSKDPVEREELEWLRVHL